MQRSVREYVLKVRLSATERDRLFTIARAAGKTVADLIRRDADRMSVRDLGSERARVAMLNRINANLNMIARWVNTDRAAADAVQVVAELVAIERALLELAKRHDA